MRIRVQYNSLGSGDWVQVWLDDDNMSALIHEGHDVSLFDLVEILKCAGIDAHMQECDDSGFDLAL